MPPYGLPSYGIRTPQSFFSRQISSYFGEKIVIEPDMDPRFPRRPSSSYERNDVKALPRPPMASRTKSCLRKCRLGAVVAMMLGIVACVLGFAVVLAGSGGRGSAWMEEWALKLNTSRVGQDIIRFDRAASSSSSASPTRTTTPSNPLDSLNPFSTASPLNPANPSNPLHSLYPSLEPILGNLTDRIDNGLGNAINNVTEGIVQQIGIKDFYYLYLNGICKGDVASQSGAAANSDGVVVEECESWSDASNELTSSLPSIQSSLVIGTTNISIPLLAHLTHGVGGTTSILSALRTALLAFLITSLTSTLLAALLALPSIFFPASRLLINTNALVASLASLTSFVAALLLTVLVVGVPWAVGDLLGSLGVVLSKGTMALLFLWVNWVCCMLVWTYWVLVWFVEVRLSAYCRRRRTADEVGNWRGIAREVWRDLKGV